MEGVALRSAGLARLRCQCKNMQLITIKKSQKLALSMSLSLPLSVTLSPSLSLSHFLPNLCVKWVWPEVRGDKFFNTLPGDAHSGKIKINMPPKKGEKKERGKEKERERDREREREGQRERK